MSTVPTTLAAAVEHHRSGRLDQAERLYRDVLHTDPQHADALHGLGLLSYHLGRHEDAVDYIARASSLRPVSAVFHNNLGNAYLAMGKLDLATTSYTRAVEIKPDYAAAHSNLGNVLRDQDRFEEAVASCQWAVKLAPDFAAAHSNLGCALNESGMLSEAVACYHRALELKPDYADAHNNLGNALTDGGRHGEAEACYQRAIEINPGFAEAHNHLGNALMKQGKLSAAVACYQTALELKPDYVEALNNLGNALKNQGKSKDAIACYQRALKLKPDYAEAHSNLLLTHHNCANVTVRDLAEAHAEYEQRHAARLRNRWTPHDNVHDSDRPPRLGFLSADFGQHPVGFFLIGVLENLAGCGGEIICYSDRTVRDPLTARIQATAKTWWDVFRWNDNRLVHQIGKDRIDILFDLAGHTAGNRLLVFARKPAPIQITWMGYVGTTGLAAMDYLLADRHEVPAGDEGFYCERVLRMPDGYVCYDPPLYAPPISVLPADREGRVTFGCFNNPARITPQVIDVWAEILKRVPTSRLVLKYKGMSDSSVSNRFAEMFHDQGVDPSRVVFLGKSPHAGLLRDYHGIDMALDPFPYSGGLTTCEALWMGVPVITCPGETFASRHSLSHLSNVGLTETTARDLSDYVELAVGLAHDLPRLAKWRAELRERMAASPLCDGARFADNLMTTLRAVWREWCETGDSRSSV